MGRINCRKRCGATRSTTATSIDGEHIPECYNCGDAAYLLPFDTIYIWAVTPEHSTPLEVDMDEEQVADAVESLKAFKNIQWNYFFATEEEVKGDG